MEPAEPLWHPSSERVERAHITAFLRWLERERGLTFADYESLWQWSVNDLEGFWGALWHFLDIRASRPYERVLGAREMPGAEWFVGARLNLVDQVFRHVTESRPAIVAGNERGELREVSWTDLRAQVASLAEALRGLGVVPGDRIVAILPNVPETIVAFFACASVGAIWSVCSPDMGPLAVLDRFRQIAPRVLIAGDGYRYGGKVYDRAEVLAEIRAALTSLEHTHRCPAASDDVDDRAFSRRAVVARADRKRGRAAVRAGGVRPSAVGGVLIRHDRPAEGDRARSRRRAARDAEGRAPASRHRSGRSLLLVHHHRLDHVERAGERTAGRRHGGAVRRTTRHARLSGCCGASSSASERPSSARARRYFANCIKAGIEPARIADLSTLHTLGVDRIAVAGGVLPVGLRACEARPLAGVDRRRYRSGGRVPDGLPTLPVYEGEMQCRALGLKVEAWDDAGNPLIDDVGELVCTEPFPSMPLCFWNDADGQRYRESYFEVYPGVWRHGDWTRLVPRPRGGRGHHLRPVRRHDQPPRHPHGHGELVPCGRSAARGRGFAGRRSRVSRARVVHAALRRAAGRRGAR